jgi:hypothetical protein
VARHGGEIVDAAGKRMKEIGRTDTPDRRSRRLVAGPADEKVG